MINLREKTHIFYDKEGRGIRVALSYVRKRRLGGEVYYGYFIGYSGGGCYTDYYFKFTKKRFCRNYGDLRFWEEDERSWLWILDDKLEESDDVVDGKEKDCLFKTLSSVCEFLNLEEICELDLSKLSLFHKHEDEEYYYESRKFNGYILRFLSKYWCLLTSYN